MRLLVTGGAGYIGSTVVSELLSAGHEVTVLDNLSRGHRGAVPSGTELIVGDLEDQEALAACFSERSFDGVMHFAAFIEAGESMKEPEKFFRNNTVNTFNLLEAMLRADVKRFVFSSTAALYGNPEETPIPEEAALKPTNAYGESKLMVEQVLAWFHRIHGLRYTSLRYFNAAGAREADNGEDHHPESHLIPLVLQVALGQREKIMMFGNDYPTPDGTCVRDYIHVLDLASAHLLALDALAEKDQLIFNIGNGAGYSVREVIEVARQLTGHPIPAEEAPRRPGDPVILVAASDRIREQHGWTPRYPKLEDIVASSWQWRQKHPVGYGKA